MERTELQFPHVVCSGPTKWQMHLLRCVSLMYSPQMRRTSVHELPKSDHQSSGILQEIKCSFSRWLGMVHEWKTVELIHLALCWYVEQVSLNWLFFNLDNEAYRSWKLAIYWTHSSEQGKRRTEEWKIKWRYSIHNHHRLVPVGKKSLIVLK